MAKERRCLSVLRAGSVPEPSVCKFVKVLCSQRDAASNTAPLTSYHT